MIDRHSRRFSYYRHEIKFIRHHPPERRAHRALIHFGEPPKTFDHQSLLNRCDHRLDGGWLKQPGRLPVADKTIKTVFLPNLLVTAMMMRSGRAVLYALVLTMMAGRCLRLV